MRTTIDLPEPLHSVASSLARHSGRTLSATVVSLIEKGLENARPAHPACGEGLQFDPVTGWPVVRSPRPVTADDVAALEDEA
jgi:hypothetical protein